ncbi:MAG: DUF4386 family protein [Acidimicrobiia bacterium]
MLAVVVPVLMGACFALLGLTFEYPSVMDLPPGEVLTRLGEAGDGVVATWLGVLVSAALFLGLVVCLHCVVRAEGGARLPALTVVTVAGAVAALLMMLDLSQWVWLYPDLGDRYDDPATAAAARGDLEVTWSAFHRYVGVGIGIYGATLFNGVWALGMGWALRASGRRVLWWPALGSGALFLASIAPGVGFGAYGTINGAGFALWALWLVVVGWTLARRGHLLDVPAGAPGPAAEKSAATP